MLYVPPRLDLYGGTMNLELAENEQKLLTEILSKLTVNPAAPEAAAVVATVQSILAKLTVPAEATA